MDYNLTKEQYEKLIISLAFSQMTDTEKLWKELDLELREKNRFMPSNTLCEKLAVLANDSKTCLEKGTTIFRSRLIAKAHESRFLDTFINTIIDLLKRHYPHYRESDGDAAVVNALLYFDEHSDKYNNFRRELETAFVDFEKKDNKFWGYDAQGSDAPPSEQATAGRVNPRGISYLYAARDFVTSVLEVRPVITQYVSVAEIEITTDCILFDFSKSLDMSSETGYSRVLDYSVISDYFSQPNYGGEMYYQVTQYVSEYIKNMRDDTGAYIFDGICFKSALDASGVNYVLFNTGTDKKYRVINSGLYQVNDLLGNTTKLLPFDMIEEKK